jgi:hypothetical protein
VLRSDIGLFPYSLACNAARNLVYFGSYCRVGVLDGTSGEVQKWITTQSYTNCGWCPGLDRLFCPPVWREDPPAKLCLLSAVDGTGDTLDGFLPLRINASSITLDTVHNRLYFAYPDLWLGCIGMVDCSRNVVTSYKLVPGAEAVCYNSNNDRLYWGVYDDNTGLSAVTEYDCATDSVVKRFPVNGSVHAFRLHQARDKLYAETWNPGLCIIDCKLDTLLAYIPWPDNYPRTQFLVPEENRYWYLGPGGVIVLDCIGDTIVANVQDNIGSVDDACACPEDRKIYAGWGGRPAWIVDMDDPAHVDTLHPWIPDAGMRFINIPGAHKVYWCVNYGGRALGNSRVFVIDTRTSTITDSFGAGRQVSGMCLDHTGRYVYGTVYRDSGLFVIDTQADSVLSTLSFPTYTYGPPLLNRATNRIYPLQSGSQIPVVSDSVLTAVAEPQSSELMYTTIPTFIRRATALHAGAPADLFDASGRRAAVLKTGPNDISHLVPGVYFVREEPQATSNKPIAVRKIIIAR